MNPHPFTFEPLGAFLESATGIRCSSPKGWAHTKPREISNAASPDATRRRRPARVAAFDMPRDWDTRDVGKGARAAP